MLIIYISFVAEQWKLLGQEKDGSLLICWLEEKLSEDGTVLQYTVIGHYDRIRNKLEVNIILKKYV